MDLNEETRTEVMYQLSRVENMIRGRLSAYDGYKLDSHGYIKGRRDALKSVLKEDVLALMKEFRKKK